jgi:hypothetical protein
MMRIGVIPPQNGLPATIQCLRRYIDLPITELRARLADARPVIDLPFEGDIVPEVRRCRSLLRDLDATGATVRVWESVEGRDDVEVPREFLHNWMRTLIGIAKDIREDMDREAARDEG